MNPTKNRRYLLLAITETNFDSILDIAKSIPIPLINLEFLASHLEYVSLIKYDRQILCVAYSNLWLWEEGKHVR